MNILKYLTSDEVCKWLHIEKAYLSRLINEKEFPVTKLGHRSLRFDEKSVSNWLEKRKQGTGH